MNEMLARTAQLVRPLLVIAMTLAAASCSGSGDETLSEGSGTVETTTATDAATTPVSIDAPITDVAETAVNETTATTTSVESIAVPLQLVAIGDSTANADRCPGCTGYVDQYAAELKSRTGRPVGITRIDASVLPDAQSVMTSNSAARDQVASADVVLVAVGFNDVLPDPEYTARIAIAAGRPPEEMGCVGDLGDGMEGIVAWLLTTTPECERAQIDAAEAAYDTVFARITELRHGAPTALLALNVYDANHGGPDWQNIDVPAATMEAVDQWILDAYERWNPMLCDAAARHGFTCVDVFHALNGPDGTDVLGDLSVDGAHPSQAGHDLIAGLLADVDTSSLTTAQPTAIAFHRGKDIALLDAAGDDPEVLPLGDGHPQHPNWSPDTSQIVYEREADNTIWVAKRDGSNAKMIFSCTATCEAADDPSWSPDGSKLALWWSDGPTQWIDVVDIATGEVIRSVEGPELIGPVGPRWSPDGTRLLVALQRFEPSGSDYTLVASTLGIIDLTVDAPVIEPVTTEDVVAAYPDWSPSGDRIVFQEGNAAPFDGSGDPPDLFTVRPDGTELTQITHHAEGDPWLALPDWTALAGRPVLVTLIHADGNLTLGAIDMTSGSWTELVDANGAPISGAHPRSSR